MRARGLVVCWLLGLAACGHTKAVEPPAAEPPAAEVPAAPAPRKRLATRGPLVTEDGLSLTTSAAGQLKPGAAKLLQERLARAGALLDEASGRMDAATRTALSRFQKAHDLPATGEPDDATVRKLGLDPRDVFRSGDSR